MSVIEIAKIQIRRGQENTTGIPQLDPGEFGWAEDTQHLYIGKRIAEGANSDANSRILTEIDLGELKSLLGNANTSTVISNYTYRTGTDYILSAPRVIQSKLDDLVNLKDFAGSAVALTSGKVITTYLEHAIKTLYANSQATTEGDDPRRRLMIPAGNYTIDKTIDLPPYTYLVGEGQDITTLTLSTSTGNMFRTVDALGVNFGGSMQNGSGASRGVQISNMTLAYSANNTNSNAIISLDNTKDAKIENVTFTTINSSSFVTTGTGINIQSSGIGSDESTAVSRNVIISKCQFTSLYSAVNSQGFISRPIFENNVFTNLTQGLNFSGADSAHTGTTNALVIKNKFDFILNEAINVATNINPSNLISSENVFYCVGNNNTTIQDDFVTVSTSPVITFNAPGNISSNDYFNRKYLASIDNGTSFYYNPLVSGNARVNDASTYKKVVIPKSTSTSYLNQPMIKIPLTGSDQTGLIDYQLTNSDMSRKGRLIVNISSDGYASVSDYFNSSEYINGAAAELVFSTLLDYSDAQNNPSTYLNYVVVTCSSFSTTTTSLTYSFDLMV